MGKSKIIEGTKFRGISEINNFELFHSSHTRNTVIEFRKRDLAVKMVMEMPIEVLDEVFNMHEKGTESGVEIRCEVILKEKFDPIIPNKE
ncbi:hypothetical protein [Elizabethkingia ursingii]|uniref:hypothetical protein n=1 Tax=Elizabethkingia ursingii TaxID=1756150 RepID=UPI002010F34B|nr:hypothetical protein [Elizabethkingia ursingii]MCL1671710.1 hypothetical protein [Elizabethkingia ursingii]